MGTQGTGKTTLLDKIVTQRVSTKLVFSANYHLDSPYTIETNVNKILAWPTIHQDSITIVRPAFHTALNEQAVCLAASRNYNLLLAIDDIRIFLEGFTRLKGAVSRIFQERRDPRNQDIILCCHSFDQLPREILDYEPTFVVKRTSANIPDGWLKKYPIAKRLKHAASALNSLGETERFKSIVVRP